MGAIFVTLLFGCFLYLFLYLLCSIDDETED